jgi:hypothetical protein
VLPYPNKRALLRLNRRVLLHPNRRVLLCHDGDKKLPLNLNPRLRLRFVDRNLGKRYQTVRAIAHPKSRVRAQRLPRRTRRVADAIALVEQIQRSHQSRQAQPMPRSLYLRVSMP